MKPPKEISVSRLRAGYLLAMLLIAAGVVVGQFTLGAAM